MKKMTKTKTAADNSGGRKELNQLTTNIISLLTPFDKAALAYAAHMDGDRP